MIAEGPLGRVAPPDWQHVRLYSLTAATWPEKPTPVALGVNWYAAFDRPELHDGRYWIGRRRHWGALRGGHCICVKPNEVTDPTSWWRFYDQGVEGACTGFGTARMMSQLNRRRYNGFWTYHEAQLIDGIPDSHEGSTVRAACEIWRSRGGRRVIAGRSLPARAAEGISAYRWAQTVDDVLWTLAGRQSTRVYEEIGGVPLTNSWGKRYPHVTWLALDALARLLGENGEAAVVTDR